MNNMTDRELAIAVAEKFGYFVATPITEASDEYIMINSYLWTVDQYLKHRAADILFDQTKDKNGLTNAERVDDWLWQFYIANQDEGESCLAGRNVAAWWRTITPRKVLEVYLELESE